MAICKTEALVLYTHDFRETSLIANFYTRDFGKLSGLLKGIRTDPKKFASTLEPFSCNEIVFYQKRNSELHLVSQCDIKYNFPAIRQNIVKTGAGSIIMELLHLIMPLEDTNAEVFALALDSLRELETTYDADKIMMLFKIKLLALSGFKPHFESCVSCGVRIISESKFSNSMGGLLCHQCSKKDTGARSIFRGTIASILHIQRNEFSKTLSLGMNPQIKKELDVILNSFVQYHLGKKLKTEAVLNTMR